MRLLFGDCLEVLTTLEADSIDSLITDPPGGIKFMGKEWDSDKGGRDQWIAWLTAVLSECYRVLKPGAMCLVWAIPRTSHWTGTAIENAGFEIRDQIFHLFGSGFPKSLSIDKAIDQQAGIKRELVKRVRVDGKAPGQAATGFVNGAGSVSQKRSDEPATDSAKTWQGYGTALKPAAEIWWLAMKPIQGTFAANALEHGVAGLWIDGCRVPVDDNLTGQLPNQIDDDIIRENGGISWENEQSLTSIIASIVANLTKAIEQGKSLDSAIEIAVSLLSGEQRKTLSDISRMDTSCLDGQLAGVVRQGVSTSTSLNIDTFGKNITAEKSLMGISSITLTEISKIIASKILSLCHVPNIQADTCESTIQENKNSKQDAYRQGNTASVNGASGRWPANVLHDGSPEVLAEFARYGERRSSRHINPSKRIGNGTAVGFMPGDKDVYTVPGVNTYSDQGTAARFFYCAKSSKAERTNGGKVDNNHPTVKPLALCRYLARLTKTPAGGVVLDPFMGSGSIGIAALLEGRDFIGIEKDEGNYQTAVKRIEDWQERIQRHGVQMEIDE